MKNTKQKNQIFKYANATRLIDLVDNTMTTRKEANGGLIFNKNFMININVFAEKGKQTTYFLGLDDAMVIAHQIKTNTFDKFAGFGGVGTSRVLQIVKSQGKYLIKISLYKAIKGKNGQTIPDKNAPLGEQSIQVPEIEMLRLALVLESVANARIALLATTDFIPMTHAEKQMEQLAIKPAQSTEKPAAKEEPKEDIFTSWEDLIGE